MRIVVLIMLALAGTAPSASAAKTDYCGTYAKDFADGQTQDKTLWQHKYDIALKECLADVKPEDATTPATASAKPKVIAPKVVAATIAPVKPAPPKAAPIKVAAAAKPEKPQPGTPEWNDYCTKKYKSYDVTKASYMSLTGVERKCIYTGP